MSPVILSNALGPYRLKICPPPGAVLPQRTVVDFAPGARVRSSPELSAHRTGIRMLGDDHEEREKPSQGGWVGTWARGISATKPSIFSTLPLSPDGTAALSKEMPTSIPYTYRLPHWALPQ